MIGVGIGVREVDRGNWRVTMSVALNTEIDWLECYLDFLLLYMSKSLVVI